MTTDAPGSQPPDPSKPPAPSPARESTARRVLADAKAGAAEAARVSAPVIKTVSARLGDWLATVVVLLVAPALAVLLPEGVLPLPLLRAGVTPVVRLAVPALAAPPAGAPAGSRCRCRER